MIVNTSEDDDRTSTNNLVRKAVMGAVKLNNHMQPSLVLKVRVNIGWSPGQLCPRIGGLLGGDSRQKKRLAWDIDVMDLTFNLKSTKS